MVYFGFIRRTGVTGSNTSSTSNTINLNVSPGEVADLARRGAIAVGGEILSNNTGGLTLTVTEGGIRALGF